MKVRVVLFLILILSLVIAPSARANSEETVRVEVTAFVDFNGDKLMNAGEGIENAVVLVSVGERSQAKTLEGGRANFSLPYPQVETVQVEIPYLALGEEARSREGTAQVQFRLDAPELPVYLP